ncbi:MAG: hypothetical protein L3J54_04875, partial [Draconibacterium sp.]|nr:hypothetical protein [Draconibacterium sp.]
LYFESDMKMATGIGILIVFLMQQAFVLLRVFLRTWILSSQLMVYDDDFLQLAEVEVVVQSIVEQKVKEIEEKKEIFSESVKTEEAKESLKNSVVKKEEENDDNSDYKIDFSKTFAKPEIKEDNVISEEDLLKQLNEKDEEGTENDKKNKNDKDDLIEFAG